MCIRDSTRHTRSILCGCLRREESASSVESVSDRRCACLPHGRLHAPELLCCSCLVRGAPLSRLLFLRPPSSSSASEDARMRG
eukprot:3365716-Rhodomonas_salina.1